MAASRGMAAAHSTALHSAVEVGVVCLVAVHSDLHQPCSHMLRLDLVVQKHPFKCCYLCEIFRYIYLLLQIPRLFSTHSLLGYFSVRRWSRADQIDVSEISWPNGANLVLTNYVVQEVVQL
jgi:hypothetical protein